MFEAQYLFQGTSVFSPWFPRGGDRAIITLDLISITSGDTLTVELFEKNNEDPGDGLVATLATGSSTIAATAAGRSSTEYKDLKELVRYKFTCSGSTTDRALFRMLSMISFDDVKA